MSFLEDGVNEFEAYASDEAELSSEETELNSDGRGRAEGTDSESSEEIESGSDDEERTEGADSEGVEEDAEDRGSPGVAADGNDGGGIGCGSISDAPETDIYGRPRNLSAVAGSRKYVPPHLRKAPATKSEQQVRLHRQVQGLINRLSQSNIESIFVDVEKLYRENARNDVTSAITEIVLGTVAARSNLLHGFVILYAAFVAGIHRVVGVEFGAHVVQALVELYERHAEEARKPVLLEDGADAKGAKEANNLLQLLAEMYNFQVVASVLVHDILKSLVADLSEVNVEMLLTLIRGQSVFLSRGASFRLVGLS
ncbi:MAG: armadillo-type protein [Olpidium bornovanus]|uniref:Armadillo-type protein n=1 Tax=Olpidium bornovanus TaxID=278681 RepID=A0A8H8DHG6_9FUNG|nr:MAG: armadillo-type protein [Olpidium bornovanus]